MRRGKTRDRAATLHRGGKKLLHSRLLITLLALVVVVGGIVVFFLLNRTSQSKQTPDLHKNNSGVTFDSSVSVAEKTKIKQVINQHKQFKGIVHVHAITTLKKQPQHPVIGVYVPVSSAYATRLKVTKEELNNESAKVPKDTDGTITSAIAKTIGANNTSKLVDSVDSLDDNQVAFVPVGDLSDKTRLLTLDNSYYLDTFNSGAVFRQIKLSGPSREQVASYKFMDTPTKKSTLKVNMTGVTALSRKYIKRLNSGVSPTYFSARIAEFLKDADIVHTSNEVSFKPNCSIQEGLRFCAPADTIKTLKDVGVNLVELTGNHNNDNGSEYNANTIKRYHELGWHTFGGGLNQKQAAKPYIANTKGNKVAFLGYNYADSPDGGAIATSNRAGANSFSFAKAKANIIAAKRKANFVIVDVQFFECYSYPDPHTEFPVCDKPIKNQQQTFRKIIDLGADMVIGTQAHQPQTYEVYKGKQIFYGLGNLFFDQIEWPGTERGIILTHYFSRGKLLQTKLTPTIYGDKLQVHLSNQDQASYLLNRLKKARKLSNL